MKRYMGFFLSAVLLCATLSPALEVRLEPVRRNVQLGKFIQLQLSSDKQITKIDAPEVKGAQWENAYSSSGMRNINGKVTYTRTLMLVPSAEGTVTIPPFKVHAGKDSAMTGELKIRILPRSAGNSGETKITDAVKGKVTIKGGKGSYYAGEEMEIICDLAIDERYMDQIRTNYFPELLNTGNAIFTLYTYRGNRVKFQIGTPTERVEKEKVFICHSFTARCRVLIPGKFAPGATIRLGIVQKNTMDDDFFGGFGFGGGFFDTSRVAPYTLRFTPAAPVEIKALPPVPEGVVSCGLLGQWQVSGTLSSRSLHQGEVAELVLKFRGVGAVENFRAPELKFPGFRLYPPEVVKQKQEITAKYALIPLEVGEKVLQMTIGHFSPATGKWVEKKIEFKAAVAPGKGGAAGVQKNFAAVTPDARKSKGAAPEKPAAPEQQLLYQKNAPGPLVELPLIRNDLFRLLLFLFGMPLVAVAVELYYRRRERESSTPELSAKRRRQKAVSALAGELRSKGDTPEFRERLIPLLGESMGLSAGATAGELARQMEDPELCRYFAGIESSSYMPGGNTESTLSPGGKKALLKLLKKYSLYLLCAACCFGAGASELNQEFNKGEFAKASARYLRLSGGETGYRPAMLYNYGNSRYYLKDLPEARWALNLAHLLSPGDGEIRANLAYVNDRLFENPSANGSLRSFLRDLRDHFRCDHYLLFGSFCWGLLWILWSFRRKLGPGLFYGSGGVLILVLVLCLLSCVTQLNGNYSPRRIIITVPTVELRTLPGVNAGSTESTLRGGSEGKLIQRDSSGFCRVRINGREGWLPEKSFKRAFPGKLF